jgi:hypothetical protein
MRGVKISKETAEEVRKVLAKARAEQKANYAKIKATKKKTTKASDKKRYSRKSFKIAQKTRYKSKRQK